MTLPRLDAVDPQMRQQLVRFHEAFGPDGLLAIEDLVVRREAYESLGRLSSRHAQDRVAVAREDVTASIGTGHPVRVRIYRPQSGDTTASTAGGPAVLYLHGGELVMGSVAADDAKVAALADATGTVTFSVEYRLAPEHPFPAALDDCLQVLRWLEAAVDEVDASRLALFGSSAGGGLAVAVALRMRDEGWPELRQLVLAAPMLDDRTGTRSNHLPLGLWDQGHNEHAWACVLGGTAGGDDVPAYAAAARART